MAKSMQINALALCTEPNCFYKEIIQYSAMLHAPVVTGALEHCIVQWPAMPEFKMALVLLMLEMAKW